MTRITTILIGLIFLTSCDCYQRVSGTVIDKETSRPLQGVTVYNKNKEWSKTTTDTMGHFELSNVSGGFRCPPMTVIADFKHYDKVEIKIPTSGQETIKLQRLTFQSKTTIQLMQGLWFHDQDSLASLTINNYRWTFNYKGKQANADDNYSISITDKLPEFVEETENSEFLILTNKTDTLQYEILGLTDTTFSLMYFPAGKIHLYSRKK
ncbi:MAG: carboxypeptidase-like regulatory domain-containing protein [Vicingaceae bacterium]|nr:carboxypeptidase-like regulatory domain-containing protein [Vicingaceae bacterium]